MAWRAKAHPTEGEVAIAKSMLPPSVSWKVGVILEVGHIQYRGAYHPNATGGGTHPGVEVWTDIPQDQYGYKPEGTPMAEDLGTTSPEERELVLAAAEAQGYPRDEVYSAIWIESAWKPHNYYHSPKVPPEKAAGGLIGFMPFVLKNLGWTKGAIAFRAQSSAEQAPWVGKYFAQVAHQWKYPGDTYVALAAGGYVGKPDSTVVYKAGTDAYELNKGWDVNKDGVVTVGDLRAFALKHMKTAPDATTEPGGSPPPPKPVEDGQPSGLPYYLAVSVSPLQAVASVALGDRDSAAVRLIQATLAKRGLYHGKLDGDFGPLTDAAIKEFLK